MSLVGEVTKSSSMLNDRLKAEGGLEGGWTRGEEAGEKGWGQGSVRAEGISRWKEALGMSLKGGNEEQCRCNEKARDPLRFGPSAHEVT